MNQIENQSDDGMRFSFKPCFEEKLPSFVEELKIQEELFNLSKIKSNEELYKFFNEPYPVNLGKDVKSRIENFKTKVRGF